MRSLLFVPADSVKKLSKAMASGADALIIDLEDSVAASAKPGARATAADFILEAKKAAVRPRLIVRVNALDTGLTDDDIGTIMRAAPDAVMLPKAAGGKDVQHLGTKLAVAEARNGVADGATKIIAIATETADAHFRAGQLQELQRAAGCADMGGGRFVRRYCVRSQPGCRWYFYQPLPPGPRHAAVCGRISPRAGCRYGLCGFPQRCRPARRMRGGARATASPRKWRFIPRRSRSSMTYSRRMKKQFTAHSALLQLLRKTPAWALSAWMARWLTSRISCVPSVCWRARKQRGLFNAAYPPGGRSIENNSLTTA